jgi:hypothetical protein
MGGQSELTWAPIPSQQSKQPQAKAGNHKQICNLPSELASVVSTPSAWRTPETAPQTLLRRGTDRLTQLRACKRSRPWPVVWCSHMDSWYALPQALSLILMEAQLGHGCPVSSYIVMKVHRAWLAAHPWRGGWRRLRGAQLLAGHAAPPLPRPELAMKPQAECAYSAGRRRGWSKAPSPGARKAVRPARKDQSLRDAPFLDRTRVKPWIRQ